MCLMIVAFELAKIGKYNKKPLLMGKKEGKNNIKIMKKIRCCLLFVRLTLQI